MAEKSQPNLIPDDIVESLFVEVIENDQISYNGFNAEYLAEELSDLGREYVSCSKCLGIARDALYVEEEIFCQSCCIQQKECATVAQKVRKSIAKLKIRCPLQRGCNWVGYILEGEEHLRKCDYFLIECPKECRAVIKRNETENHVATCCPMFQVNCNYCGGEFYRLELTDHLTTCPSYPINCTECGEEMHRFERSIHIDTVCQMAEIECPYAKYSCKIGKIIRRDLLAHKKESYIEHQDMIEHEIGDLKGLQALCKKECTQLQLVKKDLGGVEMKIDPKLQTNQTIVFQNGHYEFRFNVIADEIMRATLTRLPSNNGNDEKFICITYCKAYLKESTIENEPYILRENLYAQMAVNDTIAIKMVDRETYLKYIQEDGCIYLKFLFDYDYVSIKGILSNLSLQIKKL
eukprot:TRINITY_DN1258_c0_g1_i3.p1 TRINITY_DN1258_c0_g1~~TRINITY_DN1258_c0_g1_i3.p1  ORF type:complete len:406 (-),score=34.06 TRINITY_DN1258_c0_g1_i3:36-1253(-)